MTILDLEPKEVWKYFAEISRIPRGSGNEAAVREHIIEFAKANGLYYNVDGAGNLILRRAGDTKKGKTLLFQAHMDMVCEKNSN
ncbi:MAG: cytosol nonspecific dipeptidase, partial [Paludibacteraceae bacterium]|nr:cytosol nonspecific dipeptidase [Paludibacteraceae bacterium]